MPSALASLQSKIKLSPGEQRLVKLLPASGKQIGTDALAMKFYSQRKEPLNGRLVIVGMVRSLQKKIKTVKDPPFVICSTERSGPYPIKIWRQDA